MAVVVYQEFKCQGIFLDLLDCTLGNGHNPCRQKQAVTKNGGESLGHYCLPITTSGRGG
jgi:hypothetical protein